MKKVHWKLAGKNIKNQKGLYLLMFCQMILLLMIFMGGICIFESKYQRVRAIERLDSGEGVVVLTSGLVDENSMVIQNSQQVEQILPETEVTGAASVFAEAIQKEQSLEFQIWGFDQELIDAYVPQMEQGKWLNHKQKTAELEAVITKSDSGLQVGDVIELKSWMADEKSGEFAKTKVRIVGILEEGASLPGYQIGEGMEVNDTWLFTSLYTETLIQPMMILSQEELEQNTSMITMVNDLLWVKKKPSNTKWEEQYQYLQRNNNGMLEEFSVVRENTKKEMIRWMIPLLPVFFMSMFLAGLCECGAVLLSMQAHRKQYTIYNIYGASEKDCRIVHTLTHVILHLGALVSALFLFWEISRKNQWVIKSLLRLHASAVLGGILVCVLSGGITWRLTRNIWKE